jgi:hypothetical protein
MTQNSRKLAGTALMMLLLVGYPLIGMLVYVSFLEAAPWWGAILYALVVGLAWAIPAAAIIRWMARP